MTREIKHDGGREKEGGGRDLEQLCAVVCGKSAVYYHTTHHITRTRTSTPPARLALVQPQLTNSPAPRKMHTRLTPRDALADPPGYEKTEHLPDGEPTTGPLNMNKCIGIVKLGVLLRRNV
ncbi:hypothetical protein E2C01_085337 [Portunus trituberculatus]|uniref:Uncharacterized protein n=1 Tax=Portunus trituberculatus TaxID=210409 RepID=A0A5B7J8L1_PORTR|nr:hypothetical protein [Portunus trituberculatus]